MYIYIYLHYITLHSIFYIFLQRVSQVLLPPPTAPMRHAQGTSPRSPPRSGSPQGIERTRSGSGCGRSSQVCFFNGIYGDLWWFYGDFMVILWWFYGDFMVIMRLKHYKLWFYGDFMGFSGIIIRDCLRTKWQSRLFFPLNSEISSGKSKSGL